MSDVIVASASPQVPMAMPALNAIVIPGLSLAALNNRMNTVGSAKKGVISG